MDWLFLWIRHVKESGRNNTVSWNGEQVGHLNFEFSESTSPYGRVPLLDKVGCAYEVYSSKTFSISCFLILLLFVLGTRVVSVTPRLVFF